MTGTKVTLLVIAFAVLGLSLLVRAASVTRSGVDLKPRPDALEYGLAASSLLDHGTLTLRIGDVDYPPRYPPGFPLLAAPILALTGGDLAHTWYAALFFGLLAILLLCLLGHLVEGITIALVASLILALAPESVASATVAMSETASMALWSATLLLLALSARSAGNSRLFLLAAGVCIGVASTVRYTNLALLLPALLFFGTRHRHSPGSLLRSSLLVLVPSLLGVAAVLLYNQSTFGSPFEDGYRFWAPHIYDVPTILFSPRYVLNGLPDYWETGHLIAYGRALLGLDVGLTTPVIAILSVIGTVRLLLRSRSCPVARLMVLTLFTAAPALLLFHLVYAWQSTRFLQPLLPLLGILAGSGVVAAASVAGRVGGKRALLVHRAVCAVLLLAVVIPLGLPLTDDLRADGAAAPVPPLLERLPEIDDELEPHSLVIVNFPVSLAVPALGENREILVTDRNAADPHLNFIDRHGLRGLDNRTPDVKSLATHNEVEPGALDHVMLYVQERRPVYYVYAAAEAPGGGGIQELGRRAKLVEWIARPPITVFRVEPRD